MFKGNAVEYIGLCMEYMWGYYSHEIRTNSGAFEVAMARNSGTGSRQGAVKNRSQAYNPSTGHYVKRDTKTGQFIDVKSDGKPYKGVEKEISKVKANPSVNKKVASRAERAVIKVKNKR